MILLKFVQNAAKEKKRRIQKISCFLDTIYNSKIGYEVFSDDDLQNLPLRDLLHQMKVFIKKLSFVSAVFECPGIECPFNKKGCIFTYMSLDGCRRHTQTLEHTVSVDESHCPSDCVSECVVLVFL